MSGYPSRINPAIWVAHLNQASAVSNITTTATAGVAVPKGFRHEIAHVAATKTGTCTLKIWGYGNVGNIGSRWVQLDTLAFGEANDECTLTRGVAAFTRLQATVNAISTGNLNVSFGFCE